MKSFYINKILYRFILLLSMATAFIAAGTNSASAQCPPNIDFEFGDFTGWKCEIGSFSGGVLSLNTVLPTPGRHDMMSAIPGNGPDPYGLFSKNCPNGSNHSIKLGNSSANGQAERVSYTFTIPPTQDKFSLIYNYAMVLNDGGHASNIQPRLTIEVKNLTDNKVDLCSSFDIAIAVGGLPGFFLSGTPGPAGSPVWCKNWSANSINLDGNAGKTIQISFTTTDCGQTLHFGYAYVDVNTECASSFVGATFCPDDTLVNITAPFGYQSYKWFDINNTTLGTLQTLTLNPPPNSGDSVYVELTPYTGYGCKDTLTAHLWDTLTVVAYAGRDTALCANSPVQLGRPSVPGLVYSWAPVTGLSDPNVANPVASVNVSTTYILTVMHNGGGCLTRDTVNVNLVIIDTTLLVTGPTSYCTASGQSVVLKVQPADSIQWYMNGIAIPGATQTQYTVTQTGAYSATLFSFFGCNFNTRVQQITVYQSPAAGFTVNNLNQCFTGHQFVFTNTSTAAAGTLTYEWDLGDGTTVTTTDVTHTYALPGTYIVKMKVTGDGGCADSISFNAKVFVTPTAGFTINSASQCSKNNSFVFTNTSTITAGTLQYSWDMGDGTVLTTKDVTYHYLVPGIYTVTLVVTGSGNACTSGKTFNVEVYPSPTAGFTINSANQCFPAHQYIFTNTSTVLAGTMLYTWSLGDGTIQTGTDITYSYAKPGGYPVKLLVSSSPGGCLDSTGFTVNVYPTPVADFSAQPVCINLPVPIKNNTLNNTLSTINYLWDFGNGQIAAGPNPVYSYPSPGTYTIKLTVTTVQCPLSQDTKQQDIVVDIPLPGIIYPVKDAVMNFPEPLKARPIGNSAVWNPFTSLDNSNSYTPNFKGLNPQLYTVKLKTISGCITVDTQMVKTHKKIEIYVPSVFSPGSGSGNNHYLRPLLMGFDHVNYFRLYNRWGKLLFEMKSDRPGWDGKIGNVLQEMQTVVWMIEAVDIDGNIHHRQGSTVLMR